MTSLDQILINKYKTMINLNNINDISNNTIIYGNMSNMSFLYLSGNSFINNNTTINSNMNIFNNTYINNNLSILSNLYINNNLISNNLSTLGNLQISNTSILNNLYVNNNTILGNVSINNILNTNNLCQVNANIQTNNILALNNQLNINANTINIGNINSNVNFYGTSVYQATNQLTTIDKLISLNLNYTTFSGSDIGNSCGIQFYGSNGIGFIQTSSTGQQYQIKAPTSDTINYINTIGLDQSLNVTGYSNFINQITLYTSLYVSNNSLIQNSTSILSSLYISNTSNLNYYTINNNLLSQNGNIQSYVSIGSQLYISNNSIINNTIIKSNLLVSNQSIIYNNTTINSNLNISGNTIMLNITNLGSLYISSNAILSQNTTMQSILVSGTSIINNVTILSNLNISNNTIINNNSMILSNLNCSNNSIINGNITFGSALNGITALSQLNILGTIISPLPEYLTNSSAATNGVNLWGFYRTGGIVKVRLYNTPPVITLSGLATIYIKIGSLYIDYGVIVTNNLNENLIPYIISINNGVTELINTPIIANITNDLTTLVNTTIQNSYMITYSATDSFGNNSTITRSIIISNFNRSVNTYTLGNNTSIIGPVTNTFYNLINNANFTIEAWIYLTQYVSGSTNIINLYNGTSIITFLIDPTGYLGLYVGPSAYTINITSIKVPLLTWTHVVWMRYNNNLYGFINGVISQATIVNSALNSLNTINTLSIGNSYQTYNINKMLFGSISQPLIMNIAKYSISSFTSNIDLTPQNNINVLFSITNNQDIISLSTIQYSGIVENANRYLSNYILAFDVTNGWIGPLINNYNILNNNDWTIETWIYQYNNNSIQTIIDFRNPITQTNNPAGTMSLVIGTNGYPQFWITGVNLYLTCTNSIIIPLNQWSHIVWMSKNSILYTIVNGYASSGLSYQLTLNTMNSIVLSQWTTESTNHLNGQLSQPLIRLGSKYNPSIIFTPSFDLTPQNSDTSVVFFIGNNLIDYITGQQLQIVNIITTTQRYYINNNFLNLQYNNNTYVSAYNFNNGWLGKKIYNFTPILNNNDFTIESWIYMSNMISNGSSTALSYIIDFRDPSSNDSTSGTSGWLGPIMQTDNNSNKFAIGINKNYNISIWFGNYNSDVGYPISNQIIKLNKWNHIVWMRRNGIYYGILNGYSDYSIAVSAFNNYGNTLTNLQTISLGRSSNYTTANANYQFYGYMSQVLIRNNAQYITTSRFIPQLDLSSLANDNNTVFYLNKQYTDVSTNIVLPTRFNLTVANRYLSYLPSYDLTNGILGPLTGNYTNYFNNANWTFEIWIYMTSYSSNGIAWLMDSRIPNSTNWTGQLAFGISNGYPSFIIFSSNNYNSNIIQSIQKISLNEWTHVVWMMNSNTLYNYINGQNYQGIVLSGLNSFSNINNISLGGPVNTNTYPSSGWQFNGQISQVLFKSNSKYDYTLPFSPATDLTPSVTDQSVVFFIGNNFIDSISTIQLPIMGGSIYNSWRSTMSKFIPSYDGTSNILYKYNNYSSLNSTTSWTCEGWFYPTTLDGNWRNILSTTDMNNYNPSDKIEIGYSNNILSIQNTSGSLVYSTSGTNNSNGIIPNSWNHFAVVQNNTTIYFYINGNACGTTSSLVLTNTNVIQINCAPNRLTSLTRCINGRYSQITLMTFAKYNTEFIPEPDLTPSSFTNYLIFLGNNGIDLVSATNLSIYNNNILKITNNLMPI